MWDQLPTEISTSILCRLPVKTLIRCTTLSKSFLSLITSHDFIYAHIANNTSTQLLLRYFTEDKEEKYHFESDDENFSGFQTEGLVVPFHNYVGNWFNVVGCVNGVLCLVNDLHMEGTLFILWNPSIRKCVRVPEPHYVFESYGGYESACGFGFDSVTNDYKVVRVVDLGPNFKATEVEIYSLRSGCWRTVGVGPSYSIKRRNFEYIPCFLHGSIHWVGTRWVGRKFENVILQFDMSTESFEIVEVPKMLKMSKTRYTPMIDLYVQECKGMLTLIRRKYADELRTCSVWLMKEYGVVKSWTKIYNFKGISMPTLPRAFGFRNNGEVIMVKGGRYDEEQNMVVSIDPITQGETILREIRADRCSFYLSNYVESMVLFKEGKGIDDLAQEEEEEDEDEDEDEMILAPKRHDSGSESDGSRDGGRRGKKKEKEDQRGKAKEMREGDVKHGRREEDKNGDTRENRVEDELGGRKRELRVGDVKTDRREKRNNDEFGGRRRELREGDVKQDRREENKGKGKKEKREEDKGCRMRETGEAYTRQARKRDRNDDKHFSKRREGRDEDEERVRKRERRDDGEHGSRNRIKRGQEGKSRTRRKEKYGLDNKNMEGKAEEHGGRRSDDKESSRRCQSDDVRRRR